MAGSKGGGGGKFTKFLGRLGFNIKSTKRTRAHSTSEPYSLFRVKVLNAMNVAASYAPLRKSLALPVLINFEKKNPGAAFRAYEQAINSRVAGASFRKTAFYGLQRLSKNKKLARTNAKIKRLLEIYGKEFSEAEPMQETVKEFPNLRLDEEGRDALHRIYHGLPRESEAGIQFLQNKFSDGQILWLQKLYEDELTAKGRGNSSRWNPSVPR